jgi:UDP-3-O-[3-hydroxymyristoyl] glucosamine N-acyltransferase
LSGAARRLRSAAVMPVSLGELAVRFGCELHGDPAIVIDSVAALAEAHERALSFLAISRYRRQLAHTRAAAVVLDASAVAECPVASLVCENPYATYARIAAWLHPGPPVIAGVHPAAIIDPAAQVDPTAYVGPGAVVGAGAYIGARAFIGAHCVIGAGVRIAEDVRLVARVTLGERVTLAARVLVQPGAVLGADGFGFAPERGTWVKVPQLGGVSVGADVEIGANTTIDRGAIGNTVIEEGVKLDNQIQIGHNVRIGAHTIMAACVGVSGSVTIGRRCMIGGAVGIAGHLSICDDACVTGVSFVSRSITRPGVYSSGIPTAEAGRWRRIVARLKHIDSWVARLKKVERQLGIGRDAAESDEDD